MKIRKTHISAFFLAIIQASLWATSVLYALQDDAIQHPIAVLVFFIMFATQLILYELRDINNMLRRSTDVHFH